MSSKENGSEEVLPDSTPEPPDPRSLDYARSLLVNCPENIGGDRYKPRGDVHCWHCARCAHRLQCNAWRRLFYQVEGFRGKAKPYSLLILEDEGLTEVRQ